MNEIETLRLNRNYSITGKAILHLNDGPWTSDDAREAYCKYLIPLTDEHAADGWVERYLVAVYRNVLPMALRHEGFCELAEECEAVESAEDAQDVHPVIRRSVSVCSDRNTRRAVSELASALTSYNDADAAECVSLACAAVAQIADNADEVLALAVDLLIRAYNGSQR